MILADDWLLYVSTAVANNFFLISTNFAIEVTRKSKTDQSVNIELQKQQTSKKMQHLDI